MWIVLCWLLAFLIVVGVPIGMITLMWHAFSQNHESRRKFRSCAMREMVAQDQLSSVIRRAARAEHERKRRERLKALDASEFYDGVYESEEIA